MPYVNVPNDLSKIKTKMAFNLTKRQLVCFGCAVAVGIPSYLFALPFCSRSCTTIFSKNSFSMTVVSCSKSS